MADKIHNDLQYALAAYWLEKFEAALELLISTQPESSQTDERTLQRLLAYRREQARRIRIEIRELRAQIRDYEARAAPEAPTPLISE